MVCQFNFVFLGHIKKQTGAELGQAQLKLRSGYTSVNLHWINKEDWLPPTTICHWAQVAKTVNFLPPPQTPLSAPPFPLNQATTNYPNCQTQPKSQSSWAEIQGV